MGRLCVFFFPLFCNSSPFPLSSCVCATWSGPTIHLYGLTLQQSGPIQFALDFHINQNRRSVTVVVALFPFER